MKETIAAAHQSILFNKVTLRSDCAARTETKYLEKAQRLHPSVGILNVRVNDSIIKETEQV